MKKFACLPLLIFIMVRCDKNEVKPEPTTPPQYDKLFNWKVEGYAGKTKSVNYTDKYGYTRTFRNVVEIDSTSIYVNDTLAFTETYGYQREFKSGDRIRFYLRGQKDPNFKKVNFAFWQDVNVLNNETFYYPEIKPVLIAVHYMDTNTVSYPVDPVRGGKSGKDSVVWYRYDHIIKGEYIVQ